MEVDEYKIGEEICVTGSSIYSNGYPIGTVCEVIKPLVLEDGGIPKCVYVTEKNSRKISYENSWFGYYPKDIKLTRESIINRLLSGD